MKNHMSHDLGAGTIFRFLEVRLGLGLIRIRVGIGIKTRLLVRIIIQKSKNIETTIKT